MTTSPLRSRRRAARGSLPVVIAGGLGAVVLAASFSPSLAAFTAAITNTDDSAGSGTIIMEESNAAGTVVCTSTAVNASIKTNSADCATINKYGGDKNMVPGQTVTTLINIKNIGTAPAKGFSLTPAACLSDDNSATSQHGIGDLCQKYNLIVKSGETVIYNGTLRGFDKATDVLTKLGVAEIAAGTTVPFSFAVTLDSSADQTFSGLQVSQPLTWTFTS